MSGSGFKFWFFPATNNQNSKQNGDKLEKSTAVTKMRKIENKWHENEKDQEEREYRVEEDEDIQDREELISNEEARQTKAHLKQLKSAFEFNLMLLQQRDEDINYLETIIKEQDATILNERDSYRIYLDQILSQHEQLEQMLLEEVKQEHQKNSLHNAELNRHECLLRKSEHEIAQLKNKLQQSKLKLDFQEKIIEKLRAKDDAMTSLLEKYETELELYWNSYEEKREDHGDEEFSEEDLIIEPFKELDMNGLEKSKDHDEGNNILTGNSEDVRIQRTYEEDKNNKKNCDENKNKDDVDELKRKQPLREETEISKILTTANSSSVCQSQEITILSKNLNNEKNITPKYDGTRLKFKRGKMKFENLVNTIGDIETNCQNLTALKKHKRCKSEPTLKSLPHIRDGINCEKVFCKTNSTIENTKSQQDLIDYMKNNGKEMFPEKHTGNTKRERLMGLHVKFENSNKEFQEYFIKQNSAYAENSPKNKLEIERKENRNEDNSDEIENPKTTNVIINDRKNPSENEINEKIDTVRNFNNHVSKKHKNNFNNEKSNEIASNEVISQDPSVVDILKLKDENEILQTQNMILRNIVRDLKKTQNEAKEIETGANYLRDKSGSLNTFEQDERIKRDSMETNKVNWTAVDKGETITRTKKILNHTKIYCEDSDESEKELSHEISRKIPSVFCANEDEVGNIFRQHKSQLESLLNDSEIMLFDKIVENVKRRGNNEDSDNKRDDMRKKIEKEILEKQRKTLRTKDLHLQMNNNLGHRERKDGTAFRNVSNKFHKEKGSIVFDSEKTSTSTLSNNEIDNRRFSERGMNAMKQTLGENSLQSKLLKDNLNALEANGKGREREKDNEKDPETPKSLAPLLNAVREMRRDIILLKTKSRKSGSSRSSSPIAGDDKFVRPESQNNAVKLGLGTSRSLKERSTLKALKKDTSKSGTPIRSSGLQVGCEDLMVRGRSYGSPVERRTDRHPGAVFQKNWDWLKN